MQAPAIPMGVAAPVLVWFGLVWPAVVSLPQGVAAFQIRQDIPPLIQRPGAWAKPAST